MFIKLLNALKSTTSKISFAFSHKGHVHPVVPVQEPVQDRFGWTEQQIRAFEAFRPKMINFMNNPVMENFDF